MSRQIATLLGLILFFAALMWVKGDLRIPFLSTAYAIGDLTVNWGVPEGNPIFVVNNMAPGETETRSVNVGNGAVTSRPVGVRGIETSDPDNLSNEMHIVIMQGAATLYGPKTLSQFFIDSSGPSGVPLSTLSPSSSKTYDFKVTFDTDAGNAFQNKQVIFDLKIGIAIDIPSQCEGIEMDADLPIFGTDGNDNINGTSGNDIIFSLEGNDKVYGHGGDDCIIGGTGDDQLDGGNGDDFVFGNENNDKVRGGNGRDMVFGHGGNDIVEGGNEKDKLFGNEGNDKIEGGNQDDEIEGGSGNDEIDGGNGDDIINGNEGNDTIRGRNGKDVINGGLHNDVLEGGNANDTLTGDDGLDSAQGGNGTDTCDAETEATCEL